jgi:hypothetical protein
MLSPPQCIVWSGLIRAAAAAAIVLVGHTPQAAIGTTPPASPAADTHQPATVQAASVAPPVTANARGRGRHSPYIAAQHLASADVNYALQWGVDSMQAHQTNAGNLIRFSYRVVDTSKAKVLIDKAAAPLMVSPKANVALQVPVMDKVGPLRQSTELETGKTYWMVFSNK